VPPSHVDPPLVRVLLERSSDPVVLDQPGRPYRAHWADREGWLFGPLRVSVEARRTWQAAAYRDESAAREASRRLRDGLGPEVETTLVRTATGFIRLRVRWPDGEPPDPGAVLAAAGHPEAFPVAEAGGLRVESAGAAPVAVDQELVLEPHGDWPVSVSGGRYHGRLRLRTAGGDILIINELNLESYLKGVVPAEMGPYQFPQLDALKAQSVAARTYAVAHLGDHEDEGYDICDTPACQVYRGVGAQHELTDRAVNETAGLIAVHEGLPIDAMYTSTCGGHTEDAALLFEGRGQPYLVGVPCAWDRPLRLTGDGAGASFDDDEGFRTYLATLALGLPGTAPLQQVVDRLAALCGGRRVALPPEPGGPAVADAMLAAGGLGGVDILVGSGSTHALVGLADLFDIPLEPPPETALDSGWGLRAALAALRIQGVVDRDTGEAVPHPEGVGFFGRAARSSEPLQQPLPLFERWGSRHDAAVELRVVPGTTLERFRSGDRTLAVVVVRSGGGGEADRRSAWRSWSRDRSWQEVARALEVPDMVQMEVTARGRSGRVIGLAAVGRSGLRRELEGFPIRRALDLPENLFTFHVMPTADGGRLVRFLGRGWGHGVGLCQNGAYGLARSGMTFDQILRHYYTGIEIVAWQDWPR
jgi:stage II sporulation protein D